MQPRNIMMRSPPSNPSLIAVLTSLGLTTNLQLALDAGDIASWPGSGDSWLDTSGGSYDFFLGTGTGGDSADPTFNGTPGGLSGDEYWSSDGGDFFTYDQASAATWMNNIHKANAKFTFITWVYMPNVVGRRLSGTRNDTTEVGFIMPLGAGGILTVNIANGTTSIAAFSSSGTCPTNQWVMCAASLDFQAGTGWIGFNDAPSSVSPSFSGTPSTGAATHTMRIFAAGGSTGSLPVSGSRIPIFAAWEGVALTDTEISAVFNATRDRYGV